MRLFFGKQNFKLVSASCFENSVGIYIKRVLSWSSVDAISEFCSQFLKGGNSAFIAAIANGLLAKRRIVIIRINTGRIVQIERNGI